MIEKDNVMCDTMVIVKEDFTPVCNWLLGRVVEVYHGSDGKNVREDFNETFEECQLSFLTKSSPFRYLEDNNGKIPTEKQHFSQYSTGVPCSSVYTGTLILQIAYQSFELNRLKTTASKLSCKIQPEKITFINICTIKTRRFVEWAQKEIAVVPDFHKRILFSDEAHFWLNGYVNKQNCRIWSEANPQVYVETPLHPEKLTVWCAGGILLQKR
ncbi:hypothetical protein TNCV_2481541 [Trichonephila clavipes]|nr:hypothetical protein TNCV_2481541 [Trichonephila clavipes]